MAEYHTEPESAAQAARDLIRSALFPPADKAMTDDELYEWWCMRVGARFRLTRAIGPYGGYLLQALVYLDWQGLFTSDGWLCLSEADLVEETGLSRPEDRHKALTRLRNKKVLIEESCVWEDRTHYRIDYLQLDRLGGVGVRHD